ncbi:MULTISPECIES: hypothetical protein [Rhodococcus]|uniref:hypothetical protein n=1 Tax=Rhodococcus TaxID=1827 RepID=UPI0013520F5B|nr:MULTISPECIES: hypothetical protein [Rhodococcus]
MKSIRELKRDHRLVALNVELLDGEQITVVVGDNQVGSSVHSEALSGERGGL